MYDLSHCFRTNFGDATVSVEHGKKENRSKTGESMKMSEFLDVSRIHVHTCIYVYMACHFFIKSIVGTSFNPSHSFI